MADPAGTDRPGTDRQLKPPSAGLLALISALTLASSFAFQVTAVAGQPLQQTARAHTAPTASVEPDAVNELNKKLNQ